MLVGCQPQIYLFQCYYYYFFFYNYKMTIVNNINFLYSLYFNGLFDTLGLCLIVLLNRFYKICGLYDYVLLLGKNLDMCYYISTLKLCIILLLKVFIGIT